jgi:hypothetical protein
MTAASARGFEVARVMAQNGSLDFYDAAMVRYRPDGAHRFDV